MAKIKINSNLIDLKKTGTKFNVLWLSGTPQIATGFATVAKNILKSLDDTGLFDFTILGINHLGDYYDQKVYPYKIYRAQLHPQDDVYGRTRIFDFLKSDMFDLVITIYDPFIIAPMAEQLKQVQEMSRRRFKWLAYYPVDSPQDPDWVEKAVNLCDYPVAYTNYGKNEFLKVSSKLKDKINVIHHGVNPKEYFPVGKNTVTEFNRRFFKSSPVTDKTFLIGNVGRNQHRKDFASTLVAYKKFKQLVPDSYLYLHTKENDVGGSIFRKAQRIGLKPGEDFSIPGGFSEYTGLPTHVLNMIYNSCDIMTSTNLGEGFGLSSIEAMATKTLCVMPDNTATSEILAEGRGLLVKNGTTDSEWVNNGPIDLDRMRPRVNIDDLVSKWLWAYEHPEEKAKIEEKAYAWAVNHSWDKVNVAWVDLFKKATRELLAERYSKGATTDKRLGGVIKANKQK